MYYIKRKSWFGGTDLNGIICRRMMDKNKEIKNNIRDIFIEMIKGTVSEESIHIYCDKYK